MKKIVYIALLVLCTQSLSLFGQDKLTNAVYKLKKGELEKAKELVDAASEDSLFVDRAATWYYKGYIYKDLFKRDEADNKQSPYRDQSVEFYKKGFEMEPEGTYAKSIANGLKYLAQTYYNHSATSFGPETYTEALANYEKYKATIRIVEPDADFISKDINFHLAMASTYGKIASEDSANSKIYLEKAKELYKSILDIDSNNVSANYNLGILYYNEGVEIVTNMNYDLDLFELEMLQEQMVQLFRQSLPFMKKAYDLNPKRRETIEGLQGIYISLNDFQQSQIYKKQLESLNAEDSLQNKTIETPEDK